MTLDGRSRPRPRPPARSSRDRCGGGGITLDGAAVRAFSHAVGARPTSRARGRRARPALRDVAQSTTATRARPTSRKMARDLDRLASIGGTFALDRARTEGGRGVARRRRGAERDAGSSRAPRGAWCGRCARGPPRAPDRNADIGCPRLEGRYVLPPPRDARGRAHLPQTWSIDGEHLRVVPPPPALPAAAVTPRRHPPPKSRARHRRRQPRDARCTPRVLVDHLREEAARLRVDVPWKRDVLTPTWQ